MSNVSFDKKPNKELPKRYPAFTPDSTWDIDKIRNVQTEHEEASFYRAWLLAAWMQRDGRMATVIETRLKGLLGLPFCIDAPDEPATRNETKAKKALAALWPYIMPEKVVSEVLECLIFMGFALCQIEWQDRSDLSARWVPRLRLWNPAYCYYDSFRGTWVIFSSGSIEAIRPGDGKWVLFSFRDAAPWMAGVVRSLPIPVLIRSFSWSDWSSFNETLGQTFLKAIIPAWAEKSELDDSGTPSKDLFLEQVQGIGRENRYLACETGSDGNKFDAVYESPDGAGSQSFKESQASASMEITTRILGQNLTTEVSGAGSYAATTGHEEVRQDYKEADAETIASDVREQLIRPWALYNYGDAELAPWAYYDPTPPADKKMEADTLKAFSESLEKLKAAAQGSGRRVDIEALFTRFNVPTLPGEAMPTTPEVPPPIDPDTQRMMRNVVPWKREMIRRGQRPITRTIHPQEAV